MSDMSAQTHLHKRNSTYYFRAKVPMDLRSAFGKVEVKFSLKTKEFQEAKRLARQASAEFDRQCDELRRQSSTASARQLVLDESSIQGLCELWRHHALAGDEYRRQQGLTDDEYEQQTTDRDETQVLLRQALARGQLERIEPALQQFLTLLNIEPAGNAEAWQRFRYQFLQTITEMHTHQRRRDAGEVVRTPEPPIQPVVDTPTGETSLQELFEDWLPLESDRPDKTVDDVKRTIAEFEQVVGRKAAEAITRRDIMAYRNYLVHTVGRKSKTVSKKIGFLSALFNVGIHHEKLTANPATRIPVPKDDSEERLPYDLDDLKLIFASPLYTQGERLGRDTGEAGPWLPLLSLYSGAREEELGQLLVGDIQCIDGIWCMSIINSGQKAKASEEKKRLKTRSSRRRLPIHPKLVEAGFLRYVEQAKAAGHSRLFPSLKRDKYGKLTSGFSKAYNGYTRTLGIKDPCKVFHSFRHSFRDACREAGLDEEIADALMGHSSTQKMGRNYGSSFTLRRLNEAVLKIDYPGLNVPILIPGDR